LQVSSGELIARPECIVHLQVLLAEDLSTGQSNFYFH